MARITRVLTIVFLIGFLALTFLKEHQYAGWLLMAFFVSVALWVRRNETLRGYSYTIMIFAAVSLAMYYPHYFVSVGGFTLSSLIIPLLQLIMFGMGAALSWRDFARVMQMPKGVLIGLVCQFSIMPFVGYGLTKLFSLPAEVAAGVILIGSCPSGMASNVIAYISRANLALSVTLTAIATLLAPLVTPFYMEWLAGEYVQIDFWKMMWDILLIIIFPVAAGLLFNHFLHRRFSVLSSAMPLVSMVSIGFIIVIITAAGRDSLLTVGPLLMVVVLMHNISGYVLGYWSSRMVGMPESDCRTIAIEVGLQNGGLASGLAKAMGKLATVGLAPAVFGPMMNITGSTLALWWRNKSADQKATAESGTAP
jgi:bile acid:Na+ symporter, BASS family